MNYLALDPATSCGYASQIDGNFDAGNWVLASKEELKWDKKHRLDRRQDSRIPRFWDHLNSFNSMTPVDWIFFEDVQHSSTCQQTQLWASLRATIWLFAYRHGIKIECLNVKSLKLFATGYGSADKQQMGVFAARRYPKWVDLRNKKTYRHGTDLELNDDAIDATHLLAWGIQTVSRA
jgi:Holliday junction resolvasome RuvABC endonuclease subunit